MIELRVVTYEEARLDYFIRRREAASRRLVYWARRAAKANSPLDYSVEAVSEVADEWNYYNDVIGLLGGPKEEA